MADDQGTVMRLFFPALLLLTLSGCSAEFVTKTGGQSAYAPVNEIRGGEVKYRNEGVESIRAARREDAYKKMFEYCGGKYKIVVEGERLGETVVVPTVFGAIADTEKFWHIRFECIPGETVADSPSKAVKKP